MSNNILVESAEYVFLVCKACGDKVKIAKNKGASWDQYNHAEWIADFLLTHSSCKQSDIEIRYE
jgi:hypothetical protein